MSSLIYNLYTHSDFQEIKELSKNDSLDVIVGFKEVSRFHSMTYSSLIEEIKGLQRLRSLGKLRIFLQWDVLMTETRFQGVFNRLKQTDLLESSLIDGVRVQDPGALNALKEANYKGIVHYIVEQGNHNLVALQTWLNFWPQGIKRLVLSSELPHKILAELQNELPCELEILAFGPILLFYTPRHLITPLYGESEEGHELMGTSEESPHKGFPIIENEHGTFMLNTKDLFLFDEREALDQCEKVHLRCDLICGREKMTIASLIKGLEESSFSDLLAKYERPTIKGFFRVNKTDVLFKKLKNYRLQDRGERFLGEVVDVKKKEHIAVLIKAPEKVLEAEMNLDFLSPEGREKSMTVVRMKDALGNEVKSAKSGEIIFLPHVGGLSIRTMVFLGD